MSNERGGAPAQASGAQMPARSAARKSGINWFRFWMQMLVALVFFNIVAGLVTWFFIFPKLHPGM